MNPRPIRPVISAGYEEMTIDSFDNREEARQAWQEQTFRFPGQIQELTFTRRTEAGKKVQVTWWCVVDLNRPAILQRAA